jgi:hypothetical protein
MGVTAKKESPKLEQIERATRQIESREDTDSRH